MAKLRKYKIWIVVLAAIAAIEAIVIFNMAASRPKKRIARAIQRPAAAPAPVVPVAEKGRIAIVLDDWGYNLNNMAVLRQIRLPLTLSVLPNLPYSRQVNQEGHDLGFEIILHFPMEPEEKLHLEKNTVLTTMPEREIKNILAADLASISYARGISNHMGSAAVKDARVMTIIFSDLKKRGMYFLDSYTAAKEVTPEIAVKTGLKFARRNVFLDNKEDAEYIKGQLNQLKVKARLYGQAIGIGHDRRLTMQVLKEAMPQMEKEGYRFVFLSELVK